MVQSFLDVFNSLRGKVVCLTTYGLLRLYGLEATWKDVVQGHYDRRLHENLDLSHTLDLDIIIALKREILGNAHARRDAITDKWRTLLTLSSFLLAVIGLWLPRMTFESHWMRVIFYIGLVALTAVVFGLLTFLDIAKHTGVSLDKGEVGLSSEDLKKSLINSYGRCIVDAENRTDFLVDLYKVSRFSFLISLSLMVLLFSAAYWAKTPDDVERSAIRELRSDPKLLELLRGPTGEPGADGKPGPQGDQGAPAEVDMNRLMDDLFRDPRLRELLRSECEAALSDSG